MPANNDEQAIAGIKEWIDAAQVVARASKKVKAAVAYDAATTIAWGQLATNHPALVDPDGTIKIDGQRTTFTAQNLSQLEATMKQLAAWFAGDTPNVGPTGVPETRILEVLGGAP